MKEKLQALDFGGLRAHTKYSAEDITVAFQKTTNAIQWYPEDAVMRYHWQLFTHLGFFAWMIQHRCQPERAEMYID